MPTIAYKRIVEQLDPIGNFLAGLDHLTLG